MLEGVSIEECCGCGTCLNICPMNAIFMKKDEIGNKYPCVDFDKCIRCGLCKKICVYNKNHSKRADLECYASYSKDESLLTESSSGGAFSSIALSFLKEGGVVCGCAMIYDKESFIPKHIIINSVDELHKLQGSKYVQSNIVECLPIIKKLLNDGKNVLFSGTPCQVDGLRAYLQKEYTNLFTIDIICHGAPENKLLNEYIKFIEKKYDVRINEIQFRDKKKGWGLCGYIKGSYNKKPNKKFLKNFSNNESSYYYFFQKGFFYRPNCYSCPYPSDVRPGDITIGDFWGIKYEHPEIEYKKGVSCVILNSNRGAKLLKKYGQNLNLYKSTFMKIQKNNAQLMHPTSEPKLNKKLKELYKKYGYKQIEEEFKKIYGYRKLVYRKFKTRVKEIIYRR